MSNGNNILGARRERLAQLRRAIQQAFPEHTYVGKITRYDDKLDDPELDEEKYLYEGLKGRQWTDIPRQVLDSRPDGYVLLTDEAFQNFLAAWLMRSLEDIDGENEVREFVVYAFSPKHDMVPDTTDFILHRLRALSPEQREVLRSLLMEFAQQDPSAFQRKLASDAVALIDIVQ
jgi:hypothetical protein